MSQWMGSSPQRTTQIDDFHMIYCVLYILLELIQIETIQKRLFQDNTHNILTNDDVIRDKIILFIATIIYFQVEGVKLQIISYKRIIKIFKAQMRESFEGHKDQFKLFQQLVITMKKLGLVSINGIEEAETDIQDTKKDIVQLNTYAEKKRIHIHEKMLESVYHKLSQLLFQTSQNFQKQSNEREFAIKIDKIQHIIFLYQITLRKSLRDLDFYQQQTRIIKNRIQVHKKSFTIIKRVLANPALYNQRRRNLQQLASQFQRFPPYEQLNAQCEDINEKVKLLQQQYQTEIAQLDRKMQCLNVAVQAMQLMRNPS